MSYDFQPRSNFPRRVDIIKARQALLAALAQTVHRYPDFAPFVRRIKLNEGRHYVGFSLDDPMRVSYSDKCHRHDYKRRKITTLGRYLRRAMQYDGRDDELSKFSAAVSACQAPHLRFTIVSGEEIVEAYYNEFGGHSCMTGDDSHLVNLYAINDDVVSLVKYTDGRMTARALLWETEQGATCLDRIYPNAGYHIEQFEAYAHKNGWLLRNGNGMPCGDVQFGESAREYTVSVRTCGDFPYLDSFTYTHDDPENRRITLTTSNDGDYVFDCTDGSWSGSERVSCATCGRRVHEDDAYWANDESHCRRCFADNFTECANCCNAVQNEDVVTVNDDPYCEACADRIFPQCERCDCHTHDDDRVEVEGETWCRSCADDHAYYCPDCDEYKTEVCEHEEEAASV